MTEKEIVLESMVEQAEVQGWKVMASRIRRKDFDNSLFVQMVLLGSRVAAHRIKEAIV